MWIARVPSGANASAVRAARPTARPMFEMRLLVSVSFRRTAVEFDAHVLEVLLDQGLGQRGAVAAVCCHSAADTRAGAFFGSNGAGSYSLGMNSRSENGMLM
jgi:hypothetical protein